MISSVPQDVWIGILWILLAYVMLGQIPQQNIHVHLDFAIIPGFPFVWVFVIVSAHLKRTGSLRRFDFFYKLWILQHAGSVKMMGEMKMM